MEWQPYSTFAGVFVEITSADSQHGGPGWEFGSCLWSPTRNRTGADRYSIMRRPRRGDLVLHFYAQRWAEGSSESRLAGRSFVDKAVQEVTEQPPVAGSWAGMAPYYRIELADYQPFPRPLPLRTVVEAYGEEIRGDIANTAPRFYPFNRWGSSLRTVQGIYLAEATAGLYGILGKALNLEEANSGVTERADAHNDYAEARRMARERYYFARNPALVRTAKARYGYSCQVCGFDFAAIYGGIGDQYIECHHVNPLSERSEDEGEPAAVTSIDEVAVVCANCHRMLHRQRPALHVDALIAMMSRARLNGKT